MILMGMTLSKETQETAVGDGLAVGCVALEVDATRTSRAGASQWLQPDMTEHRAARDDLPALAEKALAADILVIGTPIWRSEKSSVCTRVIERAPLRPVGPPNDAGQYLYYGRVGGVVVTAMRTASSTWR